MADENNSLPAYLRNPTWEDELNYKLWTTSGSRFRADKRCKAKGRWSLFAVTLLTSYLIIIGLLPFLPKPLGQLFAPEILSFMIIAVSILLLAYSLIEASQDYSLKAHRFHECGLHVARLYSDLRQAKDITDKDQHAKEIHRITDEYNKVLETFENHEGIDYATFQTSKREYFKISKSGCASIWMRYYFSNLFVYHFIIIFPPSLVAFLYFKTRTP